MPDSADDKQTVKGPKERHRVARPSRDSTTPGSTLTGVTGESDPLKAVEDVLVTFPAERIVLFTRPASERRYDEGIDADELQQRFGVPVQRAE